METENSPVPTQAGCTAVRPGPYPGMPTPPRCIRLARHPEPDYPRDQHRGVAGGHATYWPVTTKEEC